MPTSPPSGWYPDPRDRQQYRYWDGSQWTTHQQPAPWVKKPESGIPGFKSLTRMQTRAAIVLAAVAGLIVVAIVSGLSGEDPPDHEQTFLTAVDNVASQYESAGSDVRRDLVAKRSMRMWCGALASTSVKDWVGIVEDIDSVGLTGDRTLQVSIGKHAELDTASTALDLLSERESKTLIRRGSPLFKTVASLKEGEEVQFSGKFIPGDQERSCLYEMSLTDSGSTRTPDFLFKFTSISATE